MRTVPRVTLYFWSRRAQIVDLGFASGKITSSKKFATSRDLSDSMTNVPVGEDRATQ